MGKIIVLLGIWTIGFLLGSVTYFSYPIIRYILLRIVPFLMGIHSKVIGASVAGLITSFVTLLVVIVWAYSTKSSNRTFTI